MAQGTHCSHGRHTCPDQLRSGCNYPYGVRGVPARGRSPVLDVVPTPDPPVPVGQLPGSTSSAEARRRGRAIISRTHRSASARRVGVAAAGAAALLITTGRTGPVHIDVESVGAPRAGEGRRHRLRRPIGFRQRRHHQAQRDAARGINPEDVTYRKGPAGWTFKSPATDTLRKAPNSWWGENATYQIAVGRLPDAPGAVGRASSVRVAGAGSRPAGEPRWVTAPPRSPKQRARGIAIGRGGSSTCGSTGGAGSGRSSRISRPYRAVTSRRGVGPFRRNVRAVLSRPEPPPSKPLPDRALGNRGTTAGRTSCESVPARFTQASRRTLQLLR